MRNSLFNFLWKCKFWVVYLTLTSPLLLALSMVLPFLMSILIYIFGLFFIYQLFKLVGDKIILSIFKIRPYVSFPIKSNLYYEELRKILSTLSTRLHLSSPTLILIPLEANNFCNILTLKNKKSSFIIISYPLIESLTTHEVTAILAHSLIKIKGPHFIDKSFLITLISVFSLMTKQLQACLHSIFIGKGWFTKKMLILIDIFAYLFKYPLEEIMSCYLTSKQEILESDQKTIALLGINPDIPNYRPTFEHAHLSSATTLATALMKLAAHPKLIPIPSSLEIMTLVNPLNNRNQWFNFFQRSPSVEERYQTLISKS